MTSGWVLALLILILLALLLGIFIGFQIPTGYE